jgi:hypothetical protein
MGMSQTVVGDHYLGHDLEGDVVGQTAVQLLVFSRRILDSFFGRLASRICVYERVRCDRRVDSGWVPRRSSQLRSDPISLNSFFLTPTHEILAVPSANRAVG